MKPKYWEQAANCISGEESERERENFEALLSGKPSLEKEYNMLSKEFDKYRPENSGIVNTDKAWNGLSSRLEHDGLIETGKSINPLSRPLLKIAAIFLLIVGIGFSIAYLINNNDLINQSGRNYIASSGVMSVELSDGSKVYLNKNAKLSLEKSFPEERIIRLSGEAYFEVSPVEEKPFTVEIGNSEVIVKGTTFNVRENTSSEEIEVYIEAGLVQLRNKNDQEGILLNPGQMGISKDHSIYYSDHDDLNYLAWRTKKFRFINQDLEEIFNTLEQAYHVQIKTAKDFPIGLRMTTSYSDMPLDSILETINKAFNVHYYKKGELYIFEK